jgi:type IV secretory pathway VirB2 component (pilin)
MRLTRIPVRSRLAENDPTHRSAAANRRRVRRSVLLVAELVLVALLASAATAYAGTSVLAIAQSVDEVLNNIRNWLMGILAGLATVAATIGGVRRVFGGGDPSEQEKSKEAFKAAGWGYALAALAPLLVAVLKGIVGA